MQTIFAGFYNFVIVTLIDVPDPFPIRANKGPDQLN